MLTLRYLSRLALLLVLLSVGDALAPEAQAGLGSFFSGMATRSRVIQFCVITMVISLLIILKKFSPIDSPPRAFAPKMNYAPLGGDKVR